MYHGMDTKQNFTELVHSCNCDGHLPWFVGAWDERQGQFVHPLSAAERRANPTGMAWFSCTCAYMPHFTTRRQALRHARYIYGVV